MLSFGPMSRRILLLSASVALFAVTLGPTSSQPHDVNAWAARLDQLKIDLIHCIMNEYFGMARDGAPSNALAEYAFILCSIEEQAFIAHSLSSPYLDSRRVMADIMAWKSREKAELLRMHRHLLSSPPTSAPFNR